MPIEGEYEPSAWDWVAKQVDQYESSGGTEGVMLQGVPTVVMTMQELLLAGSDVFGPLHEMRTTDLGKTCTGPDPHRNLGRRPEPEKVEVAICDFTPDWHAHTGKLLGTGQTVRYRDNRIVADSRRRETGYAVYDTARRTWSD